MDARDARYTESRLRLVGWSLLRALLYCAVCASGPFGSQLPVSAASRAVDDCLPPLTWWRDGARAGIPAAEAFANKSPVP
jgi:hypothetical protein